MIRSTVFNGFNIYDEDTDIIPIIDSLPDIPYGELPPGVTPEQSANARENRNKNEHPLSSKEKASQNKYAEALCLRDNRKASGIAHYMKTVLKRDIDCTKQSAANRNCAYASVLDQISNREYLYDPNTGTEFSDFDFRKQVVCHMAANPDKVYELVKLHLDVPFKTWLKEQLNPMEDGDMVSLIGIRNLLNVSRTFNFSRLALNVPDYALHLHEDWPGLA